jgi:hypothetical protein
VDSQAQRYDDPVAAQRSLLCAPRIQVYLMRTGGDHLEPRCLRVTSTGARSKSKGRDASLALCVLPPHPSPLPQQVGGEGEVKTHDYCLRSSGSAPFKGNAGMGMGPLPCDGQEGRVGMGEKSPFFVCFLWHYLEIRKRYFRFSRRVRHFSSFLFYLSSSFTALPALSPFLDQADLDFVSHGSRIPLQCCD